MKREQAKKRHARLVEEIRRHDHAYYVEGQTGNHRPANTTGFITNCSISKKNFPNSPRPIRPASASAARR